MLKHCYRYCNKYGIPCEAVKEKCDNTCRGCEFVTLQERFKRRIRWKKNTQ